MQLDKTLIAIRERSALDVMDLSLQVIRSFTAPLIWAAIVGILPFALLNHWLLDWILKDLLLEQLVGPEEYATFYRYLFGMGLLVFIEAPIATIILTMYLGKIVFEESPGIRGLFTDLRKMVGRIAWCQLVMRGVGIGMLLYLTKPRDLSFTWQEALLILLGGALLLLRAVRPFVNEIILLERNPIRHKNASTITVSRRSSMLHANEYGVVFGRSLLVYVVGTLLVIAIWGLCFGTSKVFLNSGNLGPIILKVGFPFALWTVTCFCAVVRFFNYLDLRIRSEGWEVELRLRAEANRMASTYA